jgi:hypothetical protein
MYSEFGTYGLVLGVHSVMRWLIIGLGLGATVRAMLGRSVGRAWTTTDTWIGRLFVTALDLQILIGVTIYGVFSPVVAAGLTNLAVATQSRAYRFWLLEHPVAMLVAAVIAHIGFAKAKRTDGPLAHRHAALFFILALLIVLAAIPWPLFTFGRALWPSK